MSYHEFIRNANPGVAGPKDATAAVDSIITKIMKLAQRQSSGPIPKKILAKKIHGIENQLNRISGFELDGCRCLMAELRVIEKENLRSVA